MLTSPTMKTSEKWMMMNKNANTNYHCIWNCSSKYNMYKYTYIYIYIYIYRKSEAIHETGLSGNVVASFFPPIIYIHIYIHTYIYIYIYYIFIYIIYNIYIYIIFIYLYIYIFPLIIYIYIYIYAYNELGSLVS